MPRLDLSQDGLHQGLDFGEPSLRKGLKSQDQYGLCVGSPDETPAIFKEYANPVYIDDVISLTKVLGDLFDHLKFSVIRTRHPDFRSGKGLWDIA